LVRVVGKLNASKVEFITDLRVAWRDDEALFEEKEEVKREVRD